MKINVLSEEVINKIAAGEVIERPASVIKELIENSIDAGSAAVTVNIKKAGKELISVTDNGYGMDKEDAKLCVQRHTTSKIRDADDLEAIKTLGFRGEALSSIAAVSKFKLLTKERGSISGTEIIVEGGIIKSMKEVGCPEGTSVEIESLFFNTPARRKFMRSDTTEMQHIIDIIGKYILVHPEINFKLIHNGSQLLQSETDFKSDVVLILGKNIVNDLLSVDFEQGNLRIKGFIVKPTAAREKKEQLIFVNGRTVYNSIISNAIEEGYHSLLFTGQHPVAVLMLEIDPRFVDVNVHPTKREVRFKHVNLVQEFVIKAVRKALEGNDLMPTVSPYMQTTFLDLPKTAEYQMVLQPAMNVKQELVMPVHTSQFPAMKLLGQVHKAFFIAETAEGIIIIDQHIVQERTLYEKFMRQFISSEVQVQEMLKPEVIEFSIKDAMLVKSKLNELKELGFSLEHFGDNSFLLRTIPFIFGRLQPKQMLFDLVKDMDVLYDKKEEIITRMSCRASVKAGDTLNNVEMQMMLNELDKCTLPFHCPHGRPIFLNITLNEMERMFKRK